MSSVNFSPPNKEIMTTLPPDDPSQIITGYLEKEYEASDHSIDFTATTEEDILKLIKASPPKSCELDPMPMTILKAYTDIFSPKILKTVNKSLATGDFTRNLKEAISWPLLKNAGLELQLKNYRPVTNLLYISRIIECIAIDNRKVVCLILLDLSTAFDMFNHSLLLNQLKYKFRVDGTLLNCLHNYLTDRSQNLVFNADQGHTELDPITLSCSVPQGLVLGPILFTLYFSLLGDICRKHNVQYQGYADDQQEYLSFTPTETGNKEECTENLEKSMTSGYGWGQTS